MRVIKVEFDRTANDDKLLARVMRKYFEYNIPMPVKLDKFEIIRMTSHPYKPKQGRTKISITMELGRI